MAEAKKVGTTRAKKRAAPKKTPAAQEAVQVEAAQETLPLPPRAETKPQPRVRKTHAPLAEPMQLSGLAPKREDALRQAMREAVSATARGALEVNEKIIEAFQTQSDVAIDLWRSTIAAPHLSEALRLQTTGTRHAYETASAQWKDIAETTARWFNGSLQPLHVMLSDRSR
ncbi:phasin family protein [Microvirga sp. 2TAF3]|uniref:phasin family protein n=1 Tax=Microvirga sp. 2TAF3 TaxID=3233014 RepID=UPI003F9A333C